MSIHPMDIDSPWPILASQGDHCLQHMRMYLYSMGIDLLWPISVTQDDHSRQHSGIFHDMPSCLRYFTTSRCPCNAASAIASSSKMLSSSYPESSPHFSTSNFPALAAAWNSGPTRVCNTTLSFLGTVSHTTATPGRFLCSSTFRLQTCQRTLDGTDLKHRQQSHTDSHLHIQRCV